MKIAIFGLTLSSSWGNGHATPYRAIIRALHRCGHQVTFYEKDVEYYALRRDFQQYPYGKLVLYHSWDEIRESAMRDAAASDAVIVGSYCPEGARIGDDVLNLAVPLRVFYDLDTPVTIDRLATGPVEYLRPDQMPEWDLYLSFTGGRILDELRQRWRVRRPEPLFGCVDPDVHARVAARDDFRSLLSYMGTYAADRQEKLDRFFLEPARRLPNETFLLAGSLYPKHWNWGANVRVHEHVAPSQHAALYSSSRLTLNVTRDAMARFGYCPSGRFFEAAACGTPLLTDDWEGLHSFFSADELFVARSSDDAVHAISSSDEELRRRAGRARQRTLDEHTGDCRAAQLLRYFDDVRTSTARAEAVA